MELSRADNEEERRDMMRKMWTITSVLIVIFAIAAPAAAAPPEEVTIEGPSYFGPSYFTGSGTFTTTDEAGLICPSGTTMDMGGKIAPSEGQSPQRVNYQFHKQFTCDDGSGTFEMKIQVQFPVTIDESHWPVYHWVVVGGTGDYEDLKGNGSGFVAFPIFDDDWSIIGDYGVYQGTMHFPGN